MNYKIMSLVLLSTLGIEASSLSELLSNTSVDGNLRTTYHTHDIKNDKIYKDDAIGGKLHFETAFSNGVSFGASVYGSTTVFNDDNKGLISLRGETHKSYAIVGEAYLKSEFGKSMFKIGRQELETPFADADDVGMIPNTFEAATLVNNDIENTRIFLGQVQKMSGVDAEVIDEFTKVNGSKNMQVMGLNYDGISDIVLSGWHYRLSGAEVNNINYVEASSEKELGNYAYAWGLQYSQQGHSTGKSAKVWGATLSASAHDLGLTFVGAYNETKDNVAFSGFGGGPFFSNSEYLILDNAGKDAKANWIGFEFDASVVGLVGLNMGLGKITLETQSKEKASEVDFVASYEFNQDTEIHLVYSDLKGDKVGEDDAKHLRVYANYSF